MRGSTITIKYFTDQELNLFFRELEKETQIASTEFKKKCAIRNEAIFKIMYYCALRVTETTILSVDTVNDFRKQIYCVRVKGGKNNTLEIVDEDNQYIWEALDHHLKINNPTDRLFCRINSDKALSRKTLDRIMKKTCKKAGISNNDKWHCHTLRHTRAIRLAENGLDLKEVQYWLGHVDVKNTQIYYQFTTRQYDVMYSKLKKSKKSKRKK